MLRVAVPWHRLWIVFLNNFFLLVVVDFCWHEVKKNTQVKYHVHFYVHLFILHFVYLISCCWMQAKFCQCCHLHIQGWAGLGLKVFSMLMFMLESVHVVTDAKAWFSKSSRFKISLLVAHRVKLSVCRQAQTLTASSRSLILILKSTQFRMVPWGKACQNYYDCDTVSWKWTSTNLCDGKC